MILDRLRYEFRLMGNIVLLTPPLLFLGFALFAALLSIIGINSPGFLSAGLEMFLPVAMGLVMATVCIQDPALELQLTMPYSFANTVLSRMLLIIAWSACTALGASALLAALHLSVQPQQAQTMPLFASLLVEQLTWLAPLLWFVSIGACTTLLTHSRTASAALLSSIWLVETLFFKPLVASNAWLQPLFLFPTTLAPTVPYWLTTRVEVLLTALLLLPLSWLLLRNKEGLLKGSNHE